MLKQKEQYLSIFCKNYMDRTFEKQDQSKILGGGVAP